MRTALPRRPVPSRSAYPPAICAGAASGADTDHGPAGGPVLRGSLLPLLVRAGIVYFAHSPAVAVVLGSLFALSFAAGSGLRRRAGHTVRCSVYGVVGGVLDKSMAGFRDVAAGTLHRPQA